MSENTEQKNKKCVPRVRKAATALTTAHITKSSTYGIIRQSKYERPVLNNKIKIKNP